MEKTVFVKDMSCQHCVKRIEKALQEANIKATVDLETKTVRYAGDDVVAKEAIEEAGYTVEAR